MLNDLRCAARSLVYSPAFAITAILTLAVGIGASAAMFDLVNAYYLRPPAGIADSSRLVNLRTTAGTGGGALTYLDFADLRERTRTFSGVLAYCRAVVDLGRGAETRRVPAALVSSNYFTVLGARLMLGRGFLPHEETLVGAAPVAVISHRLWLNAFMGDQQAVGRTLTLNGRSFTVVGIGAPGFRGPSVDEAFDVWVPLAMFREINPGRLASVHDRVYGWLSVTGRLARNASLNEARAESQVLAPALGHAGADNGSKYALALAPTRPSFLEDSFTLLLIAGVGILFLTMCANLSNLFLARANTRRKEIATRLAVGASRARVMRRLLMETVLLGLLGGALALALASPVVHVLLAWSTAQVAEFPDPVDLTVSSALVAFVLGLSVVGGVALGLGPALALSGINVAANLKEGGGGRSVGRSTTRRVLVICQLSLSLVLLHAAGLGVATLRKYQALVSVPKPERVLLVSLQPSHQGYSDERAQEYFRQLLDRVRRLPGVAGASVARDVSLTDASFFPAQVSAQRGDAPAEGGQISCGYAVVSPEFFRTLGVPLVRGRDFAPRDRAGAPRVVVVNQTLARRLWGEADPIGRVVWLAGEPEGAEVVGVASDRPTRDGLQAFLYEPLYQPYAWPASTHVLQVRTSGNALELLPAVRREAAALDGNLPVFGPRSLEREIAGRQFFERLAAAVMGGSGLLALLLATIGLYAVVSNWVSQSTHEIGVRMALGARAGTVLAQVVGRAATLTLIGAAIGWALAQMLNRLWIGLLFGGRTDEPVVLATATLLLIGTALVASYLPAVRAARVDPMRALRCE